MITVRGCHALLRLAVEVVSWWPARFDACEQTVAGRDCGFADDTLHQQDGHGGLPQRLLTGPKSMSRCPKLTVLFWGHCL